MVQILEIEADRVEGAAHLLLLDNGVANEVHQVLAIDLTRSDLDDKRLQALLTVDLPNPIIFSNNALTFVSRGISAGLSCVRRS